MNLTPNIRRALAQLRDAPLTDEQHALRETLTELFEPWFARSSHAELESAFIEVLALAAELVVERTPLDVH